MLQKFKISNYTKIYFRLNSAYRWGSGWSLSPEQDEQYHKECDEIANQLGLLKLPSKGSYDTCTQGVNKFGEFLYFHPMDISGTIKKSNIKKYSKIISQFKSDFFSVRDIDTYEIDYTELRYMSNYSDNPNVIYEEKYCGTWKLKECQ